MALHLLQEKNNYLLIFFFIAVINTAGATNGKLTGYAAASNNNSIVQDGYGTGTLIGLTTDSKGIISGLFNNGQTDQLFQVTLGDFLAPSGLQRAGQNLFLSPIIPGLLSMALRLLKKFRCQI